MPEISLTFIASGINGQGSCDHVKNVVNQLKKEEIIKFTELSIGI